MSIARLHLSAPTTAAHASHARVNVLRKPAAVALKAGARARCVRVRAGFEDQDGEQMKDEQVAAMKSQYDEAMKDPAQAEQMKQMQAAMSNPEVQEQMKGMSSFMENKDVQERIKSLEDDPEMEEFFKDIKEKGPGAVMKYMNDPVMLQKMMEKIGPVAQSSGAMPAPPPPPEVENLLDAAKYGDLEAVEDFVAVGKDVNETDDLGRTPLHFAVAYDHTEIVQELLANKADVNKIDTKNNTPLHYSAGYGRLDSMTLMLDAGADVSVQNDTGKTAADLAGLDERNPISQNAELMRRLTE